MVETLLDGAGKASLRRVAVSAAIEHEDFHPDIQGLRAIAVISVVLFHVWPGLVPGGFVGVDVFFVISGYLITGLLYRELRETGRISLLKFYERRIKRLLPGATLVLIAVALAMPLLPPSRWQDTAIEMMASALYVENWPLAWLAVDYLDAENAASPVQHYWSLSIEEQFYIIWPPLMIVAATFSRRFGSQRACITTALLTVVVLSFGASLWFTATSRESAYFVTYTRVWQLGVGALLAVTALPEFSSRSREIMRAAGLAAILIGAFGFSRAIPFPGYAALLLTLGCALLLAAGKEKPSGWSLHQFLVNRPMQYIGDISYSVYLWHWPVIIFAGLYINGEIGAMLGLALIASVIALADLTRRILEDPVRRSQFGSMKALGGLAPGRLFSFGLHTARADRGHCLV